MATRTIAEARSDLLQKQEATSPRNSQTTELCASMVGCGAACKMYPSPEPQGQTPKGNRTISQNVKKKLLVNDSMINNGNSKMPTWPVFSGRRSAKLGVVPVKSMSSRSGLRVAPHRLLFAELLQMVSVL